MAADGTLCNRLKSAVIRPRGPLYLRLLHATLRPTDDHGVQPILLVVFQDEIAALHFQQIAWERMRWNRVYLPIRVLQAEALKLDEM